MAPPPPTPPPPPPPRPLPPGGGSPVSAAPAAAAAETRGRGGGGGGVLRVHAAGAPAFHSTTCDRAHAPAWEASAGSSLIPIQSHATGGDGAAVAAAGGDRRSGRERWVFGSVLDPRSPGVQRWNRGLLLARAAALAADPLFFYAVGARSCGGGSASG
uniref:Uncharacterized protein n=1 Tax=Ananas comosus var. bracteatus TaxID=296719 RepID=A0A6V7Q4G3_ANACO|nr:unnamed protein product [Ananas comosus var. bracteatus]